MIRQILTQKNTITSIKSKNFFSRQKRTWHRNYTSSKIEAPPMVYISGEEYTRYAAELYYQEWIHPFVDTSKWEFYDLSCMSRDQTNDKVLKDCIDAGKRIGAIYKEPTITPTAKQVKEMGLSKAWGSPNGSMRAGWNGITISRDTIHIPGMELGFENPVLFDRHAVGGEYGAKFGIVGPGVAVTTFEGKDGKKIVIDERELQDESNAVVFYHNPYDNVTPMAHHFFGRCLKAGVTPFVVTKKTVFKWQEEFWRKMKEVFDESYKTQFQQLGLLEKTNGELQHFLSDVATMQLVRWSKGGFGMCAHNYDGDILTDEIAQIHRSPGFLTSVLNGVNDDGTMIKEFEASHGTVTDMWDAHLRGEETSLNPLSMMEALIGAMKHSAILAGGNTEVENFANRLQSAIYAQMVTPGKASRDVSGSSGLTTESFVAAVRERLEGKDEIPNSDVHIEPEEDTTLDDDKIHDLFNLIDSNGDGSIDYKEFKRVVKYLGIAPPKKIKVD